MTRPRTALLILVLLVAAFAVGHQVGQQQDEAGAGGWPIQGAEAAPLTWNLAAAEIAAAPLLKGSTSSGAPDLIQARGQETYMPSTLPPSGTPDTHWDLYYYPQGVDRIVHARAMNDGQTTYEEHGFWHNGIKSFWSDRRMGEFLIDSSQAVAVLHAAGGALASQGYAELEIDYQLMEWGGSPTWDVVYREPFSGESVFTGHVDAMTGLLIGLTPSFPPLDLADAVTGADATTVFAADAELTAALALEAPSWGMRAQQPWAGGGLQLPVSTIELDLTDALASSWYVEFYSKSLNETAMFLVVGDEAPVLMQGYPTSIGPNGRQTHLSGASPIVLDLEDSWNALLAAHASGTLRLTGLANAATFSEFAYIHGEPFWNFWAPPQGDYHPRYSVNANTGQACC